MLVNLIKSNRMFNLTLPQKIKGQYWIRDIDNNGKKRDLISIEAVNDAWILKSNETAAIADNSGNLIGSVRLEEQSFFRLKIFGSSEKVHIFVENNDTGRNVYKKYAVRNSCSLSVGRNPTNIISFADNRVSGSHAKLIYDNGVWSVSDTDSSNGTYVNGMRISSARLSYGDCVFIMGLRIVVGYGFFAINNPDNLLNIKEGTVSIIKPQVYSKTKAARATETDKDFFYRSPQFHKSILHSKMKIDPPPPHESVDTVPVSLMLGPSLTMGITSLGTGLLSVNSLMAQNGDPMQALPTLMMSGSMLLGTVLWPILTKKHEKKTKLINEEKRQKRYSEYLEQKKDEIKRLIKDQSEILNSKYVSVGECQRRIAERSSELWERVIGHNDFLRLRLGVGEIPLDIEIAYNEERFTLEDDSLQDAMLLLSTEPKTLKNVPICFSLIENRISGIIGEKGLASNMLKQLIVQMVSLHSYDELKLMVLVNKEEIKEWNFLKCIPHLWDDSKKVRFFAADTDEIKEISARIETDVLSRKDKYNKNGQINSPHYVIISTDKELMEKCESLKLLMNSGEDYGASVLILAEELKDLPKETDGVISVTGDTSSFYKKNDTSGDSLHFVADRISEVTLDALAEDLANIELDQGSQGYVMPNMLTFLEMFNVGKIEHLNSLSRWKENNPTISLQTPVGIDSYGNTFCLDLHEKYHGPHGLVAGMTGSGKSEFIITFILSMAANYHPDEVSFILIDYKGGGLAGAFENGDMKLPHLAGTITNLDGAEVNRSLISIQSELRRRQAEFNKARKITKEGTMDIYKYQQLYRDRLVDTPIPHLFIISDEFAELKAQQPEFMEQLISAARIGRSLGVHLILATQKPSGVVDDQIWSNSKFRVCLKVQEKADSQEMIKCPDAAEISQTGRFYLQVGYNELFALGQSAWCGADYIPTDSVEKSVDSDIQIIDNLGRVIKEIKPQNRVRKNIKYPKQIVEIVKYLSDLAVEENVSAQQLWLPAIPGKILLEEIEKKYSVEYTDYFLAPVVGEYDDPFNQKQLPLTVPFSSEGNCLVYGSTGNGKTTFLTTLCYSLIKNYSPEEVNLYLMDFGSGTLKAFEQAPHVGGVVLSSDSEKAVNLFKILHKELESRKKLFSDFGGDYRSYCETAGKPLPNIVVAINNYSGFVEEYDELVESFSQLSRDGVKYGIYFAITAGTTNAVSYRIAQNFKNIMTMQLNDSTDYPVVVGHTDGITPSKYKGRGLVHLDKVYEFQTAYCSESKNLTRFLESFCEEQKKSRLTKARRIPILPEWVDMDCVGDYIGSLNSVPVGIGRHLLNVVNLRLDNKLIFPVMSQEIYQCNYFAEEFIKVISKTAETVVIDAENYLDDEFSCQIVKNDFDQVIVSAYQEMLSRNNTYKDSGCPDSYLESLDSKVYVIIGLENLTGNLSGDVLDKFNAMLNKGDARYKIHFVIIESYKSFTGFSEIKWYKENISGSDGLWIGYGVYSQYLFKTPHNSNELFDDVSDFYGFFFSKNRPIFTKLLSSQPEPEE